MEDFSNLKDLVKLAYNDQLQLNTTHIEELMDEINERNLSVFKQVLNGVFDIRKGNSWKIDMTNEKITVKNVEVFEKVIPIFISFSKRYSCDDIRDIFNHCRNANNTFNFAAINRIRTLVNLIYNDKNNTLDIPIKEFMNATYKFTELGSAKKSEITDFCNNFAEEYAKHRFNNPVQTTITLPQWLDEFAKRENINLSALAEAYLLNEYKARQK